MSDEENINNQAVLDKISSVFGSSSDFSGQFIKVGIVDTSMSKLINALNKKDENLNNSLKEGHLDNEKGINRISDNLGRINSSLDKILNTFPVKMNDSINKLLKEKGNKQEEEDFLRKSGFFKNLFSTVIHPINSLIHPIKSLTILFDSMLAKLPVWIKFFDATYSISKEFVALQFRNIQIYKELNNSGVFFKDSFSDLHRYASEAGISLNELSKSLIQHSQGVARLYGVTNNGVDSFNRLLKGVRETGSEIGMNFSTAIKIAGQMAEDSSLHLFMTGQSMENLVGQTEIYQKQLQKLSLATGKSTESILAETKARDDEVTKKLWLSDPKNKMLYNFLKAQGIDEKVIQAYITGVPTAEYVQASVTSRAVGDYLENIRGINRSKYQMSDEEFSSSLMNAMKGFDINTAREELGFFSDNMLFTEQFAASVGGFRTSLGMLQSIPLLINKDFDDLIGKNLVSERIDAFVSKFKSLWENMLKDFSMDEDKMNKAFDLMDRFFIRLHTVIDSLLNGNLIEGLKKLFYGSTEETGEVLKYRTKEKQSSEQKIKELEERLKEETDKKKKSELESQIKNEEDRLSDLNREISRNKNELYKQSTDNKGFFDKAIENIFGSREERIVKNNPLLNDIYNSIKNIGQKQSEENIVNLIENKSIKYDGTVLPRSELRDWLYYNREAIKDMEIKVQSMEINDREKFLISDEFKKILTEFLQSGSHVYNKDEGETVKQILIELIKMNTENQLNRMTEAQGQ